jgi:ribosomal protein L7Ae-like RNA K-turn-binding protein
MDSRKSKKPKKSYNLLDFVVIRKKDEKTNKIVAKKINAKKPQIKRGKVKRKKPTTTKKKIVKERIEKRNKVEQVTEQLEEIKIEEQAAENQQQLHSRNFREYCDHLISPELRNLCEVVLQDLFRYQENKFQQNPVKAKANRRYVVGFKEVRKFLIAGRLKLIFIAPDLEKNTEVDNLVDDIKTLAHEHTPYVFGAKRRRLGYLLLKKVAVSIVGIFDYQGTTENVNSLMLLVDAERINYENKRSKATS